MVYICLDRVIYVLFQRPKMVVTDVQLTDQSDQPYMTYRAVYVTPKGLFLDTYQPPVVRPLTLATATEVCFTTLPRGSV
jgi:hypothetical protein